MDGNEAYEEYQATKDATKQFQVRLEQDHRVVRTIESYQKIY